VNVPDCEGVTPTDIAVREGHWETVDKLLEHNPIIRPERPKYLTNLLYEVTESGKLEVVRIILKCGNSVNTTHKHGYTPLNVAAKSGHKEMLTSPSYHQISPSAPHF
jgi:ankyrin repeat protein